MKRAGKILSLVTLIVVLSTSLCFAGELTLKESYPKDGATGASIENLGVKLYFDSSMTAEKAGKVNADVFTLTGPDGKKLPTRVLYPEKEDGGTVQPGGTEPQQAVEAEDSPKMSTEEEEA